MECILVKCAEFENLYPLLYTLLKSWLWYLFKCFFFSGAYSKVLIHNPVQVPLPLTLRHLSTIFHRDPRSWQGSCCSISLEDMGHPLFSRPVAYCRTDRGFLEEKIHWFVSVNSQLSSSLLWVVFALVSCKAKWSVDLQDSRPLYQILAATAAFHDPQQMNINIAQRYKQQSVIEQ